MVREHDRGRDDAGTGEAIIREARRLIGTRWVHQGRDPALGLDCLGLLILSVRRAGIEVEDFTAYSGEGDFILLASRLKRLCVPVPDRKIRLADVLVFEMDNFDNRNKPFTHVAFAADKGAPWSIIHCWANVGRAVENILNPYFQARLREVWRLRALQ